MASRQVLVCPGCQSDVGWQDDLDRCSACGSARLVRRLGEIECRDCGEVGGAVTPGVADGLAGLENRSGNDAVAGSGAAFADPDTVSVELEREIEQALQRVLGRLRVAPAR